MKHIYNKECAYMHGVRLHSEINTALLVEDQMHYNRVAQRVLEQLAPKSHANAYQPSFDTARMEKGRGNKMARCP
jgi:hypothetical protein